MPTLPDDVFVQLVEQHRRELRLHCYRMLGSSHDSDDVVQETFVRAWRAKDSLADHTCARPWLYRIATNVCLDELGRRPRRWLTLDAAVPEVPSTIEAWVEPCPDGWLEGVSHDPAARYEVKEAIAIAFVAALQALTPVQRATLLLRDVVGLTADEASRALEMNLEATNSALHRARAAVQEKVAGRDPSTFAHAPVDDTWLGRYLRTWTEGDIDAFVALLHDDVKTSMPPTPRWIVGRAANIAFYRPMFASMRREWLRVVPIGANGQPAAAFYRATAIGEAPELRAIHVIEVQGGVITRLDHFMLPEVFPSFGLPGEISRER